MLLLLFKQTGPSAIDLKPQLADRKTERPPTKSSFSEIDLYLVGWLVPSFSLHRARFMLCFCDFPTVNLFFYFFGFFFVFFFAILHPPEGRHTLTSTEAESVQRRISRDESREVLAFSRC